MASKIIDRRHHRTNPWYEQITNVVKFTEAKEEETYYSIKPLDYVSIIVKTNENKFIIVEQYRPAVNQITYEFPSGLIENQNEEPLDTIIRELEEETNYLVEKENISFLGELLPDTGRLENKLFVFFGTDAIKNSSKINHRIKTKLYTKNQLVRLIKKDQFIHSINLSALCLAIFKGKFKI